jgi:hypothetical protein
MTLRSRPPIVIEVASDFALAFESFFFERNIAVGGVVIAQAPKVRKIVAEIDQIETRDPVPIDLLLVNEFMPKERL